jgi:hypothetical protein
VPDLKDLNGCMEYSETDIEDLRRALEDGASIEDAARFLCRCGAIDEVGHKAVELGLAAHGARASMQSQVTAQELLASVGLTVYGPIPWKTKCPETRTGIYVITTEAEGVAYYRVDQSSALETPQSILSSSTRRQETTSRQSKNSRPSGAATRLLVAYRRASRKERKLIKNFVRQRRRLPFGNLKLGDREKPVLQPDKAP